MATETTSMTLATPVQFLPGVGPRGRTDWADWA